ncbi:sensor histidine kinase [Paenibacillus ginsengarvi]|uniref:histidine kinase n=1 Tax=Paenibacillus ginsengarvi TaxID=400777 RepID=A0A3B0CKR6_9BACL|nr:sensor histidine kinase [Paenibacillus ginsengarvi]RKN85114.1 sensor histidine kinase [Paenibacillus ginsengarvi]
MYAIERNKAAKALKTRHWFDYAVIGIRSLGFLSGIHYILSNSDIFVNGRAIFAILDGLWFILLLYTLAYVASMGLILYRKLPRAFPVMAELGLSGAFFCLLEASSTGPFNFFNIPLVVIGYMSTGRLAVCSAAASIVAVPVLAACLWGIGGEAVINMITEFAVLYSIGFCFQHMIVSYRKMNEMNEFITKQNRTLEIYAKQIEALTLTEERNRLSRELHDTVGHTFATTVTGMDAVYYLIDVAPQEAKNNLRELLHVTRNGLDEVRRHIHRIAPEQEERPLKEVLSQIAREFALHTGTKFEAHTEGKEYAVSENVRLTLIRCLQESLTNANKHGKASAIRMKLTYSENFVEMKIADDGKGTGKLVEGFGLKAMSERMANLNGKLAVSSHSDCGTVIVCTIPMNKNSPTAATSEY